MEAKMKILIIEDEYGLADAISEILKIEFRHMSNELQRKFYNN